MNTSYRFAILAYVDAKHMLDGSTRTSDGSPGWFPWLPDEAEIVAVCPLPTGDTREGSEAFKLLFVYRLDEDDTTDEVSRIANSLVATALTTSLVMNPGSARVIGEATEGFGRVLRAMVGEE